MPWFSLELWLFLSQPSHESSPLLLLTNTPANARIVPLRRVNRTLSSTVWSQLSILWSWLPWSTYWTTMACKPSRNGKRITRARTAFGPHLITLSELPILSQVFNGPSSFPSCFTLSSTSSLIASIRLSANCHESSILMLPNLLPIKDNEESYNSYTWQSKSINRKSLIPQT